MYIPHLVPQEYFIINNYMYVRKYIGGFDQLADPWRENGVIDISKTEGHS